MIFTFYKARGMNVGASLVEEDKLELAKELEKKAAEKGVQLLLPTDVVIADKFAPDAESKVDSRRAVPCRHLIPIACALLSLFSRSLVE